MSEFTPPQPHTPRFIATVERMLRPLVRLLLDHGVGFPSLIELLKANYVLVADKHFKLQGKAQTDSRISLLTGVHRKDIKRLRGGGGQDKLSFDVPLAAQVLGRWTGDVCYLDEQKQPRVLPRFSRAADALSFDVLVQSVSKDIRPRSLLDEWLSAGIVTLDENDGVHLSVHAALPAASQDDKLEFLGRNVHDHVAAIAANLRESPSPFIERCVFYDGLTTGQIAQLRAVAEQRAMDALLEVNRLALGMIEANGDSVAKGGERFNFGVYFYHEASDEAVR